MTGPVVVAFLVLLALLVAAVLWALAERQAGDRALADRDEWRAIARVRLAALTVKRIREGVGS